MLLSIHLNSNRPTNIAALVENIESTALCPAEIEMIVNIDEGDDACLNMIQSLQARTKIQLKYIQTNIIQSFKDVWKSYNPLLKLTDPTVYFVTLFSDEFRFKTQGWDENIKKYIGYYEDDIFRIRLSKYRYRNYTDFWECVFAPDSLAFYTKKWLDIVEEWCPCTGPDSWQQLVSYYLIHSRKYDHIQYHRDIPDAFIEFDGEGAGCGLNEEAQRKRNKDNVDLWFDTVSHKMQEKAKRAAAKLQAAIILHDTKQGKKISQTFTSQIKPPIFHPLPLEKIAVRENEKEKCMGFYYQNKLIYKISYRLSKFKIALINSLRKLNYLYYAGGGEESFVNNLAVQIYIYNKLRKYGIVNLAIKDLRWTQLIKKAIPAHGQS